MKGKADLVAFEVSSVAGCFQLTLWPCPQECVASGFSAHSAASFSQHSRNSGAALGLFVMYEFVFFKWWTVFKFFLNKVDLKTAKFFEISSWFCWAPFRFLVANGQGKPRKIVWKDTETLKMPCFPWSAVSYYTNRKKLFRQGSSLSNAILRQELSRELWLQEGNCVITLFKSIIACKFLGKQRYIINIGAQHCSWPIGIPYSDFPQEKSLYSRWVNVMIGQDTHFRFYLKAKTLDDSVKFPLSLD